MSEDVLVADDAVVLESVFQSSRYDKASGMLLAESDKKCIRRMAGQSLLGFY